MYWINSHSDKPDVWRAFETEDKMREYILKNKITSYTVQRGARFDNTWVLDEIEDRHYFEVMDFTNSW